MSFGGRALLTVDREQFLVQGGEFQVRGRTFEPGQRLHVQAGNVPENGRIQSMF